jgi:glycosyltransferase involved in cell wall biosynthesis
MSARTLCMIHEGIGQESAIAKVAMQGVKAALSAGWKVSVVAHILDERLRGEVEWLRLYVPPRFFLFKWLTARRFILSALQGRRFDVIHGHQPQIASLCDAFTCHFLTHAARDHHALESWNGCRSAQTRIQQLGVIPVEDAYYRNWNPHTRMLFCSALLQSEFGRLYPMPLHHEVMENACPPIRMASPEERAEARAALVGREWNGLVAGYLGGLNERKGYPALLDALRKEPELFLLLGGESTEQILPEALHGRGRTLGWSANLSRFFAACDVVIVPSAFDPCPLAVLDSVAHGVPVIATSGVGNLPTLLRFGAGLEWQPGTPLMPLIRQLTAHRTTTQTAALTMARALSELQQSARLLQIYNEIRQDKQRREALSASSPSLLCES